MEYMEDAADFSAFFSASPAAKSTPHLYISALSTWHQHSHIWKHWKCHFTSIPSIILLEGAIVVPLLSILLKSDVRSIALSPDGNQIASGSWDTLCRYGMQKLVSS
jgi:WD40 repeat protein